VQVRAVGTAFGVRREAGGTEILVTEGVVAVSTGAADAVPGHIKAGERAFVADRAASVDVQRNPDEVARRLAWREGKIIFMNHTLRDAVADFNRYSNRTIVIVDRGIEERTLVGQYQVDAPERFARDVAAFLHVPVAVTAKEIRIGRAI
jgi:transmembrane sensor